MVGLAMNQWPDDALRRVVEAPPERWYAYGRHSLAVGWWAALELLEGRRVCLYGFRAERGHRWGTALFNEGGGHGPSQRCPAGRYDRLTTRFGLPRTVHAIQARARRILASREQAIEDVIAARLVVLTESDEPVEVGA